MLRPLLFLLVAVPMMLSESDAFAWSLETGFLNRVVTIDGTDYRFQVYVPFEYSGDRDWPAILFLHGVGERGTDGLLQTQVGLPAAIRLQVDRFPAIVIMPQAREPHWWSGPMEELAMSALDQTMSEFSIDPSRVYLTGLSMGGYGSWHIAARNPERFAALAVICGGIVRPARLRSDPVEIEPASIDPYAHVAEQVRQIPTWIFHGDLDTVVPVEESRRMAEALERAGAAVQYTEFEGVGHNAWDPAYHLPEFAAWLFAQRRE
jgi:predicted peptidase